jgi:hypothetical protein
VAATRLQRTILAQQWRRMRELGMIQTREEREQAISLDAIRDRLMARAREDGLGSEVREWLERCFVHMAPRPGD